MSSGREHRATASGREGLLQHLVVGAIACLLTVSIAGSALYFVLRWRDKQQEKTRIQLFVDGLSWRSMTELGDTVRLLRQKPALAARVLPVVVQRMRAVGNTDEGLGVVRVAAAFAAEEPAVAEALFGLRRAGNESIAAEAVAALGGVRPAELAAERLGLCLEDAASAAVVDVACERLLELGAAGRKSLEQRMAKMSADRRWWLVGLIEARRPADEKEWLGMMTADESSEVSGKAREAIRRIVASG